MSAPTLKDVEGPGEAPPVTPGEPGLLLVASGPRPLLLPIPLVDGRRDLGRDELEALRVPDERVSRRHLRVERRGDVMLVRDEGSTNGVFVDGERLAGEAQVPAQLGAVLRIGRTLLLLVPDLSPFSAAPGPLLRDGIVVGPILAAAHRQIAALARAGQGIFLQGESGAGKEIAARVYHEAGPRRAGRLVAVNCATIPKELAERLLFGAVRGAYSGAVSDAEGYLQAASGGTLFLDEVAELDLAVQAKLLRAVETRTVTPLGGTRAQAVDIGLCAATLRDLRAEVAAGALRQDLYYRIGRPEVVIPPLRARREEIPTLVTETLAAASGPPASVALIEACLARPWPGNVRELCAEVRAAAVLAAAEGARAVLDHHLAPQAGRALGEGPRAPAPDPDLADSRGGPPRPVGGARAADPRLRAAAESLGLSQRTAAKLLSAEALLSLEREAAGLDAAARAQALRGQAAAALGALLAARAFSQREVADELGLSRTTLLKLIDDLGLPRARELGAAEIDRARAEADGDLDEAARLLRVSPTALRQRLAALRRGEPRDGRAS